MWKHKAFFSFEKKYIMGTRFQKRITIVPGFRLNLSKSGVSTTIGKRGLSVTNSKRGQHLNVGMPGTGLSYRTKIADSKETAKEQQKPQKPPKVIKPITKGAFTAFKTAAFILGFMFLLFALLLYFADETIAAIVFGILGTYASFAVYKSAKHRYQLSLKKEADENVTTIIM